MEVNAKLALRFTFHFVLQPDYSKLLTTNSTENSKPTLPPSQQVTAHFHPEMGISPYTGIDGTVEFYGRVKSILEPDMKVLDFGAGRGQWAEEQRGNYWKETHRLKGHAQFVVGCDVDAAIFENTEVDEAVQIDPDENLPFNDEEFDLIVSDFTFEHIQNSEHVAIQLARILKPGGWLCARTPNKYGYKSIATQLVGNSGLKQILLGKVQPDRDSVDMFPTVFKLNTKRQLKKHFPDNQFSHFVYYYFSEPSYFFNSKFLYWTMSVFDRLLPKCLYSNLFIFIRKN